LGVRVPLPTVLRVSVSAPSSVVNELVELFGSNEGPESVTAEELDQWVASFPIEVPARMERAI